MLTVRCFFRRCWCILSFQVTLNEWSTRHKVDFGKKSFFRELITAVNDGEEFLNLTKRTILPQNIAEHEHWALSKVYKSWKFNILFLRPHLRFLSRFDFQIMLINTNIINNFELWWRSITLEHFAIAIKSGSSDKIAILFMSVYTFQVLLCTVQDKHALRKHTHTSDGDHLRAVNVLIMVDHQNVCMFVYDEKNTW